MIGQCNVDASILEESTMKRFAMLLVGLVVATPVLSDDAPNQLPRPDTSPRVRSKQVDHPFGVGKAAAPKVTQVDPFSAPPSAKRPPVSDPFGAATDSNAPASDDPFGGTPTAKDPFAANPVANPYRNNAADIKKLPRRPAKSAAPSDKPSDKTDRKQMSTFAAMEAEPESIQRIECQLAVAATFDYLDTPLHDIIDEIAIRHAIPIIIDVRALEDYGISSDTPISITIKGISLRSALNLMLRQLDLTYAIRDEVLHITTLEQAESTLRSRFYSVSSLLPQNRDGKFLVSLITRHVAPDSWDEVGGPGAISYVEHVETLTVTQTEQVHYEIDALLKSVAKLANRPVPAQ